jgi:hypothetical protein
VGVEAARHLGDRVTVAAQVTQLLTVHVDMSLRVRGFVWAKPTGGFYVGLSGHAWYSPLILERVAPAGTAEIGYEWRKTSGFTLGVGLGAGAIYVGKGVEGRRNEVQPLAILNLRVGKSW